MRILLATVLAGFLLAFGSPNPSAAQEQLVTLRGGIWAIDPPDGFVVLSDPVAGLKHPSGAFIVIQDLPKAPVSRTFFDIPPDQQAQARVDEVSEVTVNGRRAFLGVLYIHAQRSLNIMLIVEGETSNGMITALLPDNAVGKVSVEELRQAVLTAVERPKDISARLEDLPFVIGDMAGMRVATYAVGVAVLLTDGPLDDMEETADQTFVQVGSVKNVSNERLDENTPLGPIVDSMRKKFPAARILSDGMIETPQGNVLEVRYERTTKTGKPAAGVMWLKIVGDRMLVLICQYPVGNSEGLAKLVAVRDGLSAK
jgi:hypothetical protein